MSIIDLRSDTITRPTPAMRQAMHAAALGDDTLGDDPTVRALEERIAAMLGKQSALFVPSGTMANLLAIRTQTEPGDEIICHADSHICYYETGGYAAVAGCSIRFITTPRGLFGPGEVERLIRYDDPHFPQSRLVTLENTMNRGGGVVWPLAQIEAVAVLARQRGLRLHIDGARIWNAAVRLGVTPAAIAQHADTVSCCFSKGLGCPAGSALAGDAPTIARARRFRKMLGGSMRQSGLLAAAALYALDHHVERLADDHVNARRLAEAINRVAGLSCDLGAVETNLVYFEVDPALGTAAEFCTRLDRAGVRMLDEGPQRVRAVCHLDVSAEDIDQAASRIASAAAELISA